MANNKILAAAITNLSVAIAGINLIVVIIRTVTQPSIVVKPECALADGNDLPWLVIKS